MPAISRADKTRCVELLCPFTNGFTFNLAIMQTSAKTKKTSRFIKKENRGPLVNESNSKNIATKTFTRIWTSCNSKGPY